MALLISDMLNHRTRVIANDTISERASNAQERMRGWLDALCHTKLQLVFFLCVWAGRAMSNKVGRP